MPQFSQSVTLDDVDVQRQIRELKGAIADAKRVYIVTGAGISVSAGIPVRRTLGYNNYLGLSFCWRSLCPITGKIWRKGGNFKGQRFL